MKNDLSAILQQIAGGSLGNEAESKTCVDGHQVYLNRGYRWDKDLLQDEAWSSPPVYTHANLVESPLLRLRNREHLCGLHSSDLKDSSSIPFNKRSFDDVRPLPMGAMAWTDINTDGRPDIIFAYSQKQFGGLQGAFTPAMGKASQNYRDFQEVYINTGKGFKKDNNTDYGFPERFYLAVEPMTGWVDGNKPWLSDLARFVDVDNDGLIDIVTSGLVKGPLSTSNGFLNRCNPARWYRNQGVVPDLLTRVESYSGSWTEIDYLAATSPLAQSSEVVISSGQLPSGLMLVKEIRSASGPQAASVASGAHKFPIEIVSLQYANYIRDDLSSESIGFEKVLSTFKNSLADGAVLESVVSTQTFDVNPTFSQSTVRYPLKGLLSSQTIESGPHKTQTIYNYDILPMEGSARIRQRSTHEAECFRTECKWWGNEVLLFDDYGNPKHVRQGNSDGLSLTEDDDLVVIDSKYENRTNVLWRIGLLSDEKTFGYREKIDGTITPQALLSHKAFEYDPKGRIWKEKRPGITPSDYAVRLGIPIDDILTHDYYPSGLLKMITSNHHQSGLGTATFTYDPQQHLHVATKKMTYTEYRNGHSRGSRSLTEGYETDLRNGETKKFTDVNGKIFTFKLDSHGRTLEEKGPGSKLLTEHTYRDMYPVKVTSKIHTANGMSYDQVEYLDGTGQSLGVIEGGGVSVPVRTKYFIYDAFGRIVTSYLPAFVSNFVDLVPPENQEKKSTTYDGFDRPTIITLEDGRTSRFTYRPRITSERNPRGYLTRQNFNWREELIAVTNYGENDLQLSNYTYVRDGMGRMVRIIDPDGNIRQIERDLEGRLRYANLPHRSDVSPPAFSFAYNLDDDLIELITPENRTTTFERDEVGRPIHSKAVSSLGSVENFLNYDDASSLSLGRLWEFHDESGVKTFSYDGFGRTKTVRYTPAASVVDGTTTLNRSYTVIFDYARRGHLKSVSFEGLPVNTMNPETISLQYTRDNRGRSIGLDSIAATGTIALGTDVAYDAQNRLRHVGFGNGGSADWTYDLLSQWLTNISYLDESEAVWGSLDYTYDLNGNTRTETRRMLNNSIFTQKEHQFDPLDRLIESSLTGPMGSELIDHEYSLAGDIRRAGAESYHYDKPQLSQAVTRFTYLDTTVRNLSYDDDGQLVHDEYAHRENLSQAKYTRDIVYDAADCMRNVEARSYDQTGNTIKSSTTQHICGQGGRRVFRKTVDNLTNDVSRVINLTDFAEIRPDENILLLRIPLSQSILVEEARSLTDGSRVIAKSGYVFSDLRGSILARASFNGPANLKSHETEYDAWGKAIAVSSLPPPTHAFIGEEPDPHTGYYHFGKRVYDPTLRRWLSPDPPSVCGPLHCRVRY